MHSAQRLTECGVLGCGRRRCKVNVPRRQGLNLVGWGREKEKERERGSKSKICDEREGEGEVEVFSNS